MKYIKTVALLVTAATALAGCTAPSSSGDGHTIKVAYQDYGNSVLKDFMTSVAKQFEAKYKGDTVQLIPIKANEADYYTKLSLMNRTASTAPDVMYEDGTFIMRSDVQAGYLAPLDSYLSKWADWSHFYKSVYSAGQIQGKTYGISTGTDVEAVWYNKEIFKQAGIAIPWQPKTWQDLLDA